MSKRFGRNQKRKMRATILEQATELRGADRRIKAMAAAQQPMRDALDSVARVLGKHFIALPAAECMVEKLPTHYRVMAASTPTTTPYSNNDMAMMVSCSIYELEVARMDSDIDLLRRQVHLRLRMPSGELGYALSAEAMYQMRTQDWQSQLSAMIAFELGSVMAERWKK
jgi:hypothetical protein